MAGVSTLSGVPLGSESFENPAGSPESYSGNDYLGSFFVDGNDYFALRNLSAINPPLQWGGVALTPVTGQDGNWAIVSEDVDDAFNPLGAAGPAIIRISNVDVSSFGNLEITVSLGTHVAWNSSWETNDHIRIEYAFDQPGTGLPGSAAGLSSSGYSVAGAFYGNGSSLGTNTGFSDGPVLDSNGSGAWEPSEVIKIPSNGSMQDFTFSVPGAGTSLSVQVVIAQSGGSEEVVIDNIRVTGETAATDPPALANIEAGPVSFTEGGAPSQITNTITVIDPDSNIASATARIQVNNQASEDVLSINGTLPPGITADPYNPATGTLTLTGSATPAAYQTALRQVQYSNTSTNPNGFIPRTVRFAVSDGSNASNSQDRGVIVISVITEPLTIPHTESFDTDGDGDRYTSNSFSDGLGTPADYFERTDANPHPGQQGGAYTFSAPQGGGYFAAEDVASSPNPLGPAAPGIVRLPSLDSNGLGNLEATIYLADLDNGSTFDGGEKIEVQVAFDGARGGTDLETGTYTTVGRFVADAGGALRQDSNLDGISTDPADAASPTLTSTFTPYTFEITGSGNLLSVQVVVTNTSGNEEIAFDQLTIEGAVVGDPPVLASLEGAALGVTEGDPATALTATITTADADSTNLESATVQLTTGYIPGEDVLAIAGPLPAGIAEVTFNPGDGSIGLTGTASLSAYQAALRQITYQNTGSPNPNVCERTVTFQANDGTSNSNILSRLITVAGFVSPGTIPYLEDFNTDGDGTRYTSNSFTDGQSTPQDYFERTDSNPHPGHAALTFTAPQSGGYWTSEDVDNAGNKLGDHGIVRLRDLDMTGLTDRKLGIFLTAGGTGFDTTEKIEIQYAYDAGSGGTDLTTGSYTTVGRFINNGGTLRQDTDLDGISTDPEDATSAVLTETMTEYAFPLPDTGNILSLQVRVTGTSGSENVSFDHLFVDGTAPVETVVNADDDGPGSLRQTIADSLPGSTILFDTGLNGATITLTTGQLLIDKKLTIDGSALARGITISGGGLSRVLQVTAGTSATLDKLTIADGSVPSANGGGIFNQGTLAVRNCALLRNSAFGGGAIASIGAGASLEVVNSTITANSALFAGAILSRDGSFHLIHSTVSGNLASGGTGALVLERGTATVENSIVAGNRGSVGDDFGGINTTVTAVGANVIGTNDGNYAAVFPADGILVGTDADPVDPLLAPFGRYGGGTGTMHPLAGSPAFDSGAVTGDSPATDQRGLPRNVGGSPDIGAVEGGPVLLVTNTNDSGPGSLRQAILDATSTSSTRIYFDPTVFPATIAVVSPTTVNGGRKAFIDASDIPGGVTVSGGNTNHHFTINGSSEVAMTALTLTGGDAGVTSGGALIVDGATLVLNRSSMTGNTAGDHGGAILLYGDGNLALNDSLVADNKAANAGGGIMNFFGGITATNTTFSGNQASQGAAIWVQGNSKLRLTHATVSANTGPQTVVSFVPATLENSIVAGNSGVNYTSGEPVTGLGNNLLDGDPLLAPLADYGGPTRSMPPRLDSPALNEATMLAATPLRDQRGFARPQDGAPDIGAVERAEMFANSGPVLVNDTSILLDDTVRRDDTTADTLFFSFTVDPLSDFTTENYFAALQLYQGGTERLGVGNDFNPWAYSAFNTAGGFVDLNSSTPLGGASYEYVQSGVQRTIVFQVTYVPGGLDTVSAWLSPDLNLPDFAQLPTLLTVFSADASFDQLFLREGGSGGGWTFSNMTVSELSPFSDTVSFAALFPGLDPDGDENGDGLSNYFHYASGDDPFDPAFRPTLSGGVYTHTARINGSDVFFTGYEFSTDLEDFDPMVEGVHFNFLPTTTLSTGVEQVTIIPLFDPLLDPRVFWRFGFAPAP